MVGDKRTRKKDVLERMERQELTQHAIKKVEKKRGRESMDLIREQAERSSLDIARGNMARHSSGGVPGKPEVPVGTLESVREEHEHEV